MLLDSFLATALSLRSIAQAVSVVSTCSETDICYQLNIPDSTAASGNGDIYFQISASTAYEWVALGQGEKMAGSNMFVMYTSANGQNVTVSPRLGTGHLMPQYDSAARITVLGGSGVSNGRMVANVRCSNCNSWSGGQMDFTSSTSSWIQAHKSGSSLNSDDPGESIKQHNGAGAFSWDLTKAKGGNEQNPFLSGNVATTTSTGPADSSSSTEDDEDDAAGGPGGSQAKQNRIDTVHGVFAGIAFVGIFPIGAILVRLASFPGLVWIHAGLQATGFVFVIIAAGLGIYLADATDAWGNAHPGIGLFLFAVLFFQPILGLLHHRLYTKYGHRTAWSYAHLTVGRVAIILGIINGGLGLQLAGASKSAYIAYGVIAGIVGLVYIAVAIFGEAKLRKSSKESTQI